MTIQFVGRKVIASRGHTFLTIEKGVAILTKFTIGETIIPGTYDATEDGLIAAWHKVDTTPGLRLV